MTSAELDTVAGRQDLIVSGVNASCDEVTPCYIEDVRDGWGRKAQICMHAEADRRRGRNNGRKNSARHILLAAGIHETRGLADESTALIAAEFRRKARAGDRLQRG